MRSSSYAPRHGGAPEGGKGAALRAAVRRPLVGGALAVAMLGSVGATVAIGDPSHSDGSAAAVESPTSEVTADTATVDATRLAQDRRTTNVSRSASREQARLSEVERAKKAEAKKKAEGRRKAEAAKKKRAEEKAKPVSQREFTDAEIAVIQKDPAPYAKEMLPEFGWGEGEWSCLISLWNGESNWDYKATNSSSGAYGIPQSLPADKMATSGEDWRTNPITQMHWGMDYIKQSYGTPCGAKAFWDSNNPHWY